MTEYGRIHKDGSRSGGQPVLLPCPFCGETPTLQWHSAPECWVECSCGAIGPQGEDTSTDDHIALWNTRQPTQSDALQADIDAMESILWVDTIIDDQEAIAKAFARHRQRGYDAGIEAAAKALEADARICDCAALEANECACGAWDDYKSITSARAVEIVRELQELG